MLGMENTADACQGDWWMLGEVWPLLALVVPVPWHALAAPSLCSWSSAIYTPLFVLLPGVFV